MQSLAATDNPPYLHSKSSTLFVISLTQAITNSLSTMSFSTSKCNVFATARYEWKKGATAVIKTKRRSCPSSGNVTSATSFGSTRTTSSSLSELSISKPNCLLIS